MHWKFDTIFSITIQHGLYPPALGQPTPPAPDFWIAPSAATRKRLLQMGWVYKPWLNGGGGAVHAESVVAPDGTASLRAQPGAEEGLIFHIGLFNAGILNRTKPYTAPAASFPPYSGRTRLLYFDNLNPAPNGPNTFLLSKAASVDFPDFASNNTTEFIFTSENTTANSVKLEARSPQNDIKTFPVNTATRVAEVKLPENGYALSQSPAGQSETLFLSNEWMPPGAIGVIRLFKPAGATWPTLRHYQVVFDKV